MSAVSVEGADVSSVAGVVAGSVIMTVLSSASVVVIGSVIIGLLPLSQDVMDRATDASIKAARNKEITRFILHLMRFGGLAKPYRYRMHRKDRSFLPA